MTNTVTLAHGNGGKLTHDLIKSIFVPAFANSELSEMADSAVLNINESRKLVFTTDSHVVSPIFFPGGDIGRLSVTGTVNDLVVMGAKPLFLSCGMIIEEGFEIERLKVIVTSMAEAAKEANVKIVTGDTKVVEKGAADGIFINTSGIGMLYDNHPTGRKSIRDGDVVIVTGTIGDHGIAIYAGREGINFETNLQSDCAPLTELVDIAMASDADIRLMRDPTRGGLATTLNEFVSGLPVGIELLEDRLPIREEVAGACELLGFDPLYIANEGKLVLVTSPQKSDALVAKLQKHHLGKNSKIIGRVTTQSPGRLILRTVIGGERIVDMLTGDMLPRIC